MVVSVVHVANGEFPGHKTIDGKRAETITAFLFHRGVHADPVPLAANAGKSFQGNIVLGIGFTFDDTDKTGIASPLTDMRRLVDTNPRNREAILPYIGGAEVNSSPTHTHHRYVINFGERSESECRRRWPDLMTIVNDRVKPVRITDNRAAYRKIGGNMPRNGKIFTLLYRSLTKY